MQLYILRHGEAQAQAPTDQERELTERGRSEVVATLKRAMPELKNVRKILVSPYVRAQQTAAIAADLLTACEQVTVEALTPSGDPRQVCQYLEKSGDETLLLVSHQPLVGTFVDWICGLEPGRYRMGTSALALIETEILAAGCGTLNWLKQPGV